MPHLLFRSRMPDAGEGTSASSCGGGPCPERSRRNAADTKLPVL